MASGQGKIQHSLREEATVYASRGSLRPPWPHDGGSTTAFARRSEGAPEQMSPSWDDSPFWTSQAALRDWWLACRTPRQPP